MPSSPAKTKSVFELATIEPGTLVPFFKRTKACGPPEGGAAAGASALFGGSPAFSFFPQEKNTMHTNPRNAIERVMNPCLLPQIEAFLEAALRWVAILVSR